MASGSTFLKFIHPGTVKQGYLIKSPPLEKRFNFDAWKKRWCVFTVTDNEPRLNYYHDEEESLSALPIKRVTLLYCYKVESDLKHRVKKHVFALHLPQRVYYFSAPSNSEMVEWVDTFCANLNLTSTNARGVTMPATPPTNRTPQNENLHGNTLPAKGSSGLLPRRTPGSPLPPIPKDEISPQNSFEMSFLDTTPTASPCPSPLTVSRAFSKGEPYHSPSLGPRTLEARITVTVDRPPAPLPHAANRSTGNGIKNSSDEDEPLTPPPPPPRRMSPIPPRTLSSPSTSPPFQMDSDSPPPTPPPRVIEDSNTLPNHITT